MYRKGRVFKRERSNKSTTYITRPTATTIETIERNDIMIELVDSDMIRMYIRT